MGFRFSVFFALLFPLLYCPPACSLCTQSTGQPIRIEVFSKVESTGLSAQLSRDLVRIVKSDLLNSGLFQLSEQHQQLNKNVLNDATISSIPELDLDYLASISMKRLSKSHAMLYFKLYDVCRASYVLAKTLEFKINGWHRAAHILSDSMYFAINDINGYFNTKIVYMKDKDLGVESRRIVLADYNNTNAINLTDGSSDAFDPNFSPDTKMVVYVNLTEYKSQITIQNLEDHTKIAMDICSGVCSSPSFSPDGTQLLYADSFNNATNIKIYSFLNNTIYNVTNDRFTNTSPSYSPDMSSIVFTSNRNGSEKIYTINLIDDQILQLGLDDNAIYSSPSWSPTGQWIAFSKVSSTNSSIGIISYDGIEEKVLVNGDLEDPSWIPNGEAVLFTQNMYSEKQQNTKSTSLVFIKNKRLKLLSIPKGIYSIRWSNNLGYLSINNIKNKELTKDANETAPVNIDE